MGGWKKLSALSGALDFTSSRLFTFHETSVGKWWVDCAFCVFLPFINHLTHFRRFKACKLVEVFLLCGWFIWFPRIFAENWTFCSLGKKGVDLFPVSAPVWLSVLSNIPSIYDCCRCVQHINLLLSYSRHLASLSMSSLRIPLISSLDPRSSYPRPRSRFPLHHPCFSTPNPLSSPSLRTTPLPPSSIYPS